ncbi:MAG: hypothetical protein KBI10_01705 [Syntrophorhabdales bacterium]|nr:hypothetical protein [Syntrophorhabdales bacterium]
MSDYTQMWLELGLDLPSHDALLSVLRGAYQDIFLSQKDRPDGMRYFDSVMNEVHGLRIKELLDAKAEGRTVIGSFCVFVPEEMILAVDGVSVGLCAGAEFNFEGAEGLLPRNLCPLIKSAFAIHKAIVSRSIALLKRVSVRQEVFFAGGVALNGCVRALISQELGAPVFVPPEPQIVGAFGATLHAAGQTPAV